ncbi:MAG: hypothetical protein K0S23_483 [Fluviicola sp.]|jgi:hypothetical protein|nr:hypothetical protein [Fluviicola sp.]
MVKTKYFLNFKSMNYLRHIYFSNNNPCLSATNLLVIFVKDNEVLSKN